MQLAALARAADAARNSGQPEAVEQTSKQLIAFALRMMGQIRLLESAYPQAIELYTQSLQFADVPDTHVDLAIAELSANHPTEATFQAEVALAHDPDNARAEIVRGKGYLRNQEFTKATLALTHAMALQPDWETEYALAGSLLATKKPEDKQQATAIFQQMIATHGDNGALHVYFGRAYRDADDLQDAAREFQRAVELDPATPHAYYFLGLSNLVMNDWKPTPAIKNDFEKELQYHPRDFLTNYILGTTASTERQYESANKYLKTATEVDPSWPESWLYLGLDDYALGNTKDAEVMLRKAIATTGADESRSNYQIRRAYIDLGRILAAQGKQAEANTYLAKARELQNKVMAADQQSVAAMATKAGGSPLAAMVPLDKQQENQETSDPVENADPFARVDASVAAHANLSAAQMSAANAQENNLRVMLGQSFSDLATSEAVRGEYELALVHYQEAAHWNDATPDLAKNLGQCAFRVKNYPVAADWLARYVRENGNASPAIHAMLGMSYFATDQYANAANAFSQLGPQGMEDSTVGYMWANALAKTGDTKKSSEILTHYEKGNLSNDTQLLVGELWIEDGDYARAVDTFHRISQADPSFPKAHYFAGQADIHWEHWADAAKEFQAELELVSTDIDAQYHLGFVDLQQSNSADAEKLFRQVLAARPDYANAQYELGKMLIEQGHLEEAITHLEIAARLNPEKDYVHYQLQAAYRKDKRFADADRELAIYRELKAKSRPHLAMTQTTHP